MSNSTYTQISLLIIVGFLLILLGVFTFIIKPSSRINPSTDKNNTTLPNFIPDEKVFWYKQADEIAKVFNIPLDKNLTYNKKASEDLINTCKKYDDFAYHMEKCREFDYARAEEENKGRWFIDIEEYNALINLIRKYPSSTSALTAKLRITYVTGIFRKRSCAKYIINLLEEIRKDYPNTWQAIYATREIGYTMHTMLPLKEVQPTIDHHLKHLEEYRKLDNEQDAEFLQFDEAKQWLWWKGEYKSVFTAGILSSIAWWSGGDMDNYELGIKLSQQIIKEYPDTIEADEAKRRIENFTYSAKHDKVYNWFKETYGREWTVTEARKLGPFREQFEKEHNRKSTAEEEIEFLKKLMSGSADNPKDGHDLTPAEIEQIKQQNDKEKDQDQ